MKVSHDSSYDGSSYDLEASNRSAALGLRRRCTKSATYALSVAGRSTHRVICTAMSLVCFPLVGLMPISAHHRRDAPCRRDGGSCPQPRSHISTAAHRQQEVCGRLMLFLCSWGLDAPCVTQSRSVAQLSLNTSSTRRPHIDILDGCCIIWQLQ